MTLSISPNPLNVPDRVKLIGALVRERRNAAERVQLRALLEPAPGPNLDGAEKPQPPPAPPLPPGTWGQPWGEWAWGSSQPAPKVPASDS